MDKHGARRFNMASCDQAVQEQVTLRGLLGYESN